MPELPEVETIRRQLSDELVGKKIVNVEVRREKSFGGDTKTLLGREIESIGRRAKVIEIYFKGSQDMVIVHLKMTGQLIYVDGKRRVAGGHPSADWIKDLPGSYTRVVMEFSDGSKLFFNDLRVFGWMRIVDKQKYEKEIRKTAPDVTEKEFDLDYLTSVLGKTRRPIKIILMDQEKIGGLGNIYANDALYLAKVMPNRKANDLNVEERKRLLVAIKEVIEKGIKYGGASAENYVDTNGLEGAYQNHFLVYQKAGSTCKTCGEKIKKMMMGGRGTFYCPVCQE